MTNNNIMKVRPLGSKVLIYKEEEDVYVPGTKILLPKTMIEKQFVGTVVAIGEDVTTVKVGETVQYADYAVPVEMKHEGKKHLLINLGDIIAILENV